MEIAFLSFFVYDTGKLMLATKTDANLVRRFEGYSSPATGVMQNLINVTLEIFLRSATQVLSSWKYSHSQNKADGFT